ncbi:zinc finger SWIM domain-containing protein 7-like isoform X2 [Planococcus citri]|uniref:zinc finger SWIM domain-containing protein 7-like isoform X2 n=1 Tax=Planococcus citri TaxID=170843 RepID=UPI0031F993F7
MERALTPFLIDPVFLEAQKSFSKNEINAMLMALHSVFGKILRNALDLIESNAVTMLIVKDNSLRTDQFIYQVAGSRGLTYVIFHDINYCQCKFYELQVVQSKSYPACKHYIAARLAYIWKKFRTFEISFEAYKDTITNIAKSQTPADK